MRRGVDSIDEIVAGRYRLSIMMTQFVSATLSRQELLEIQEALTMRAMVEDDLRREEGLEPVDRRALLAKVDQLLHATKAQVDTIDRRVEEELWQHAWYSFTEEWAWYRARRDVLRELGPLAAQTSEQAVDELAHQRYHKKFDEYIQEIDMTGGNPGERSREHLPKSK